LVLLATASPVPAQDFFGRWPAAPPSWARMQPDPLAAPPSYLLSEAPAEVLEPAERHDTFWTRRRKVAALTVGVGAAIAGYGAMNWDHGSSSFHFIREGWLDRDSKYGGADKFGHAWTSYALATLYTKIYTAWDFEPSRAALYGALTSWVHVGLAEIGDGFSRSQGFSWEDLAANTAGVALAYLRQRSPYVRDAVDFRLEWIPSGQFLRGERLDLFTGYSGQRYLLAFKLGGLLRSDDPVLRALEVHVGYYTRGYVHGDEQWFREPARYGYIGLGLNATYLIERLTGRRAWNLFDYIQVPYTYLPARHGLD